jgi:hypothetical protein
MSPYPGNSPRPFLKYYKTKMAVDEMNWHRKRKKYEVVIKFEGIY